MKQRLKEKEPRKESELLVFVKVKELSSYIIKASAKAPVRCRYSLLNPLINESLAIIELLYEANSLPLADETRISLIRKALAKLKLIDFLTSLAREVSCFTIHQEETILLSIGVCSKYLEGYLNASKKASAI